MPGGAERNSQRTDNPLENFIGNCNYLHFYEPDIPTDTQTDKYIYIQDY